MSEIIEYLEKRISNKKQDKYFPRFSKQAAYMGNGIYSIPQTNIYSTDTRELFLMFVAAQEGIKIPEKLIYGEGEPKD
jgi:hypothetical protein